MLLQSFYAITVTITASRDLFGGKKMNQPGAENPDAAAGTLVMSAWPDDWCSDWYLCTPSGEVHGPLSAAEVFEQQAGQRGTVARRGFAQWYEHADFAGLWQASRYLQPAPGPCNDEPVGNAMVGDGLIPAVSPFEAMPVGASAESGAAEQDIINALAATGVSLSALTAPVAQVPSVVPELRVSDFVAPAPVDPAATAVPAAPRLVWLSQRGRARLGDLRNPVLTAVMVVLTFGVAYIAWLLSALREVVWHMDHDTLVHRHVARPWLAWIPGGHVMVTWELAGLIRAMEEHDGYTSTKPWLAALLACFPPFATLYLQHALNDHWLIHCLGGCDGSSFADAKRTEDDVKHIVGVDLSN